jgi:aminoglycoside phosphotransferase (APT) family kinase protein
VAAALALDPVPPRLVHGDLGGDNVHWSADGELLGVLDWDLAAPFDPAVDVACLAYTHGWAAIERAVDARTVARARVWSGTFPIEQIVKVLLDDADEAAVQRCAEGVVRWMDADGHG